MKRCPRCEWEKPVHEFNRNAHMPDGFQTYCRPCQAEKTKEYKARRPQLTPDQLAKKRAQQRESYRRHSDRWVRNHLKKKYGVTPKWYEEQLVRQDGRCAICRRHQDEFARRFAVDHHHGSGQVRELLCDPCNRGLGFFREDLGTLARALGYLVRTAQEA